MTWASRSLVIYALQNYAKCLSKLMFASYTPLFNGKFLPTPLRPTIHPFNLAYQGWQVLQSKIYQNVPNYIPKYAIKNKKFRKKIISLSVKMKSVAFLNDIINFLLNLPTEVLLH